MRLKSNWRQQMTPQDAMPSLAPGGKSDDPAIVDRGLTIDVDRLAGIGPKALVPGADLDPETMLGSGNHTPDDDDNPVMFAAPVSRSGGYSGDSRLPGRVTLSPANRRKRVIGRWHRP